jgi:two-component system, OmpR family, response regulator
MMRRVMMLDDTPEAALQSFDPSIAAPRATALRPRRADALVLFVGTACRPGTAEASMLAHEGMRSLWLPTLAQATRAARLARFDALVLDADALDSRTTTALAGLRDAMLCPLLVLADGGDEIDEIVALELGADAYLQRPVAPRRLRAHLAALLRLSRHLTPSAAPAPIDDGDEDEDAATWHLDRVGNRLVRGAKNVALTDVQCALLQCVMTAQGRIVPRERLRAALPQGQAVDVRSIDVYVHRLRRRLRDAGVFDLTIEAVRGRGYTLAAQ